MFSVTVIRHKEGLIIENIYPDITLSLILYMPKNRNFRGETTLLGKSSVQKPTANVGEK